MSEEIDEAERNDHFYTIGQRSVWRQLLSRCLVELGYGDKSTAEMLIVERENVIAALREVCEEFGDNNWPSNLYLPDVIEKHLARNLRQSSQKYDAQYPDR